MFQEISEVWVSVAWWILVIRPLRISLSSRRSPLGGAKEGKPWARFIPPWVFTLLLIRLMSEPSILPRLSTSSMILSNKCRQYYGESASFTFLAFNQYFTIVSGNKFFTKNEAKASTAFPGCSP